LSGLTEADAVEEYGEILCSICYPSAPVEWTNGVNKKTAAQKRLHKALLDIERSPEGKRVKKYTDDLRSTQHAISYGTSQVEWVERIIEEDGPDESRQARLDEAKARLAKAAAKAPKVQAKLEAAQAALDAALSA
jgi:exonuclease VII small subunit